MTYTYSWNYWSSFIPKQLMLWFLLCQLDYHVTGLTKMLFLAHVSLVVRLIREIYPSSYKKAYAIRLMIYLFQKILLAFGYEIILNLFWHKLLKDNLDENKWLWPNSHALVTSQIINLLPHSSNYLLKHNTPQSTDGIY